MSCYYYISKGRHNINSNTLDITKIMFWYSFPSLFCVCFGFFFSYQSNNNNKTIHFLCFNFNNSILNKIQHHATWNKVTKKYLKIHKSFNLDHIFYMLVPCKWLCCSCELRNILLTEFTRTLYRSFSFVTLIDKVKFRLLWLKSTNWKHVYTLSKSSSYKIQILKVDMVLIAVHFI